jgi:hypothetical protein
MNEKKPKELYQYQLSQLNNSSKDTILDKSLSKGLNAKFEGVTEHISDAAMPLKSGKEFAAEQLGRNAMQEAKLAAAGKMGDTLDYSKFRKLFRSAGKGLKAVPVLGALATAAMTGDASAAVPVLGEAESLGPAPDSLDARIENGTLTEEDKLLLRQQALQKFGGQ